jgi:hypothetical protein
MQSEFRDRDIYQDLKFCCDVGALEFQEFIQSVRGDSKISIRSARRVAFVSLGVIPEIVAIATEQFGAVPISEEDINVYRQEVSKGHTLGERARIGLAWRVCNLHQEQ